MERVRSTAGPSREGRARPVRKRSWQAAESAVEEEGRLTPAAARELRRARVCLPASPTPLRWPLVARRSSAVPHGAQADADGHSTVAYRELGGSSRRSGRDKTEWRLNTNRASCAALRHRYAEATGKRLQHMLGYLSAPSTPMRRRTALSSRTPRRRCRSSCPHAPGPYVRRSASLSAGPGLPQPHPREMSLRNTCEPVTMNDTFRRST